MGLSGIVEATPLAAGPVRIGAGESTECLLLNLGKKAITDVDVRNTITGNYTFSTPAAQLGRRLIAARSATNALGNDQFSWCEFDFKGGKKNVRATLCVLAGDTCRAAVKAE